MSGRMTEYSANDVSALLTTSSIDEVKKVLAKAETEVADTQSQLRQLVGQRYRDLLHACDLVVGMGDVCVELQSYPNRQRGSVDNAASRMATNYKHDGALDASVKANGHCCPIMHEKRFLSVLHSGQVRLDVGDLLAALQCFKEAEEIARKHLAGGTAGSPTVALALEAWPVMLTKACKRAVKDVVSTVARGVSSSAPMQGVFGVTAGDDQRTASSDHGIINADQVLNGLRTVTAAIAGVLEHLDGTHAHDKAANISSPLKPLAILELRDSLGSTEDAAVATLALIEDVVKAMASPPHSKTSGGDTNCGAVTPLEAAAATIVAVLQAETVFNRDAATRDLLSAASPIGAMTPAVPIRDTRAPLGFGGLDEVAIRAQIDKSAMPNRSFQCATPAPAAGGTLYNNTPSNTAIEKAKAVVDRCCEAAVQLLANHAASLNDDLELCQLESTVNLLLHQLFVTLKWATPASAASGSLNFVSPEAAQAGHRWGISRLASRVSHEVNQRLRSLLSKRVSDLVQRCVQHCRRAPAVVPSSQEGGTRSGGRAAGGLLPVGCAAGEPLPWESSINVAELSRSVTHRLFALPAHQGQQGRNTRTYVVDADDADPDVPTDVLARCIGDLFGAIRSLYDRGLRLDQAKTEGLLAGASVTSVLALVADAMKQLQSALQKEVDDVISHAVDDGHKGPQRGADKALDRAAKLLRAAWVEVDAFGCYATEAATASTGATELVSSEAFASELKLYNDVKAAFPDRYAHCHRGWIRAAVDAVAHNLKRALLEELSWQASSKVYRTVACDSWASVGGSDDDVAIPMAPSWFVSDAFLNLHFHVLAHEPWSLQDLVFDDLFAVARDRLRCSFEEAIAQQSGAAVGSSGGAASSFAGCEQLYLQLVFDVGFTMKILGAQKNSAWLALSKALEQRIDVVDWSACKNPLYKQVEQCYNNMNVGLGAAMHNPAARGSARTPTNASADAAGASTAPTTLQLKIDKGSEPEGFLLLLVAPLAQLSAPVGGEGEGGTAASARSRGDTAATSGAQPGGQRSQGSSWGTELRKVWGAWA